MRLAVSLRGGEEACVTGVVGAGERGTDWGRQEWG